MATISQRRKHADCEDLREDGSDNNLKEDRIGKEEGNQKVTKILGKMEL